MSCNVQPWSRQWHTFWLSKLFRLDIAVVDTALSDDKDITETTAISILCSKQTASFFFLMFKCSKNVAFCSFCTSMSASELWYNFRKACMQILRVAYNFGCRALYNLLWRASVSNHWVQCNIPTFEALLIKNVYLFVKWCRKSNNIRLHALVQLDCLYSSLLFEHYNCILLREWVLKRYGVCLRVCACHNTFVHHLALTRIGLSV